MGLELLLTVAGAVVGALLSWPIAYWYYRRGAKEMPDWAKNTPEWAIPLIETLPDQPVPIDRLIELYQEALESGDIHVDPMSGYIKCPRCGAPSKEFKGWEQIDFAHDRTYRGVKCGQCNYEITGDEV